jgi:ubiquinone/menaquinone biosynthesis C-methylase UbiE
VLRITRKGQVTSEREWTHFETGISNPVSFEIHRHYLERFVRAGDGVLEVGAGPGRFTIQLARIGARVSVAAVSPEQLRLNEKKVAEAGAESAVEELSAGACIIVVLRTT